MPAINLLQLRKQINALLWDFTNPPVFKTNLEEIMQMYSVTTYKPGAELLREIEAPEETIPPIVLRELDLALFQTVRDHPAAAMTLCQTLWDDPNLELHSSATRMMGQLPIEESASVFEFIEKNIETYLPSQTKRMLIENATKTIRQKNPEALADRAKQWSADPLIRKKEAGIIAVIILADDASYENLPALFNSAEILLQKPLVSLQNQYLELIRSLLHRSDVETSFFIRRLVETYSSEQQFRLVRKVLPELSEPSRSKIYDDLKTKRPPKKEVLV